jgi:hypothetical protein
MDHWIQSYGLKLKSKKEKNKRKRKTNWAEAQFLSHASGAKRPNAQPESPLPLTDVWGPHVRSSSSSRRRSRARQFRARISRRDSARLRDLMSTPTLPYKSTTSPLPFSPRNPSPRAPRLLEFVLEAPPRPTANFFVSGELRRPQDLFSFSFSLLHPHEPH